MLCEFTMIFCFVFSGCMLRWSQMHAAHRGSAAWPRGRRQDPPGEVPPTSQIGDRGHCQIRRVCYRRYNQVK